MPKFVGPLVAAVLSVLAVGAAAAQPAGGNCAPVTVMQLFKTRGNKAAMDAYKGKTLCVTGGQFGGSSGSSVNVNATSTPDHTVECDVGSAIAPLAALVPGQPIDIKGTVTQIFYGFTGRFQLTSCSITPRADPKETARVAAPPNPPMGTYAVYQGAFNYQYDLVLKAGGRYLHHGDTGRYTYDSATKVLRFTSGPIAGFVGKYYTSDRNNDGNEPVIAIDSNGKVPDIENASRGQYQYAYLRP